MIEFQKVVENKVFILFLILIFVCSFVINQSIFAGEKKEKNNNSLSGSVWSSKKLLLYEENEGNGKLSQFSFSQNARLTILNTILFQKPPEGGPEYIEKKGSNKILFIVLGIVGVGGAAALAMGKKGGTGSSNTVPTSSDLPGNPPVPPSR